MLAHLRSNQVVHVVAVQRRQVQQTQPPTHAHELRRHRADAVLRVRLTLNSHAQRVERAVEDAGPGPLAKEPDAVVVLEALAGEAKDVAHRLHQRVEHHVARVAGVQRVLLHLVARGQSRPLNVHVDVFGEPRQREVENTANDVDADEIGAANEGGAVGRAGLAGDGGRLLRAVPVHQAADEATMKRGKNPNRSTKEESKWQM